MARRTSRTLVNVSLSLSLSLFLVNAAAVRADDVLGATGDVSAPTENQVFHTGGAPRMSVTCTTTNHTVSLTAAASSSHNVSWNMAAELENTAVDEDVKVNELITCNSLGTWSRQAKGTGSLSGSILVYAGNRRATAYSDIQCANHAQGPGSDGNSANGHNFVVANP